MNLEQRLNQVKNRIGLVGGPLILTRTTNTKHNISASIDPRDWHIELNISVDYNPDDKKTKNYLKQKNISDPLWAVARDLLHHECGHWALPRGSKYGCPRSSELHDIILDAVVQAREGKQRNEQLEHYVANSFEDLLSNTFCKQQTTHSGQVLFYNDQGLASKNYGDFYEAFVKLNLFLWGDQHDNQLLKRFYKNDSKVTQAVQQVIEQLGLKQKSPFYDRELVAQSLIDETSWFDLAFKYTKIMDELHKEQLPQEQLFGTQTTFDKKLEGDKEKVIVKRFKAGKGKSSYLESFEYLDSLYRSLGREIPIKVELFSQAYSFPVAHYGNQEFDPEIHLMERISTSRIGVNEQGDISFQTHRGDISIPAEYVKNLRGFPNLRIVNLDTSGSMKEPIFGHDKGKIVNPFADKGQQWGENSKYHHALIGKYGIDTYFEMQGIAGDVDSILINVSSMSISSEKQPIERRQEENKLALSPQFGGTEMDCDVLQQSLGSEQGFLLSLSDGGFFNWDSQKERFFEIISSQAYAHIQMGSPNIFTQDLEKQGIPVYFVNQENPLEKLMVDLTQKHYQKFAIGALQK